MEGIGSSIARKAHRRACLKTTMAKLSRDSKLRERRLASKPASGTEVFPANRKIRVGGTPCFLALAGCHNYRRPSIGGCPIPQRQHNEPDECLNRRRELRRKIAEHLSARRTSFADGANCDPAAAQLHV